MPPAPEPASPLQSNVAVTSCRQGPVLPAPSPGPGQISWRRQGREDGPVTVGMGPEDPCGTYLIPSRQGDPQLGGGEVLTTWRWGQHGGTWGLGDQDSRRRILFGWPSPCPFGQAAPSFTAPAQARTPASAFLESVAWRPLRWREAGHSGCAWEHLLPGCPTRELSGGEQRPLRPARRGTLPWEGGRALICAGGGMCPPGLRGARQRRTDGRGPWR